MNNNMADLRHGTNCVGNRAVALWIDYLVMVALFMIPLLISEHLSFLAILLPVLYLPILEGIKGYTLGKLILRIRVVNEKGYPPGILKAVIRTVLKLIEANPFLVGGLPAGIVTILTRNRQRLGDLAAGTYVVLAKSLEEGNEEIADI